MSLWDDFAISFLPKFYPLRDISMRNFLRIENNNLYFLNSQRTQQYQRVHVFAYFFYWTTMYNNNKTIFSKYNTIF
jgi:hypothetical protein